MTLQVVVGGQYGSEGKGAVSAYLARGHGQRGISARVAGPNAGHTVIGRCPSECSLAVPPDVDLRTMSIAGELPHHVGEHPWRLRQVPVAAVTNPDEALIIAQGSEVDPAVLMGEVTSLDLAGYDVSSRLLVDGQATIIEQRHKDIEGGGDGRHWALTDPRGSLVDRIGSTGKGIGAARGTRAMRDAILARDYKFDEVPHRSPGTLDKLAYHFIQVQDNLAAMMRYHLRHGGDVLIEGTQGYALGTHAGAYPQCTSSDCTAIDFLSMAGVSPWEVPADQLEVWVTFRTYPIRVAGNSGPLSDETTWDALGLPPEFTTVTRKVRRVGAWDADLARSAMAANGHSNNRHSPVRVALTMADYVLPELYGLESVHKLDDPHRDALDRLLAMRSSDLNCAISLLGTGPSTMIDLRMMAL